MTIVEHSHKQLHLPNLWHQLDEIYLYRAQGDSSIVYIVKTYPCKCN